MILIIDNYDSFTYNLVRLIETQDPQARCCVRRNDAICLQEAQNLNPRAIVISPGPGTPADAGISMPLIEHMTERTPILGVCLGLQCLACVFGARVAPAKFMRHGKVSAVFHVGEALFEGIPSPFEAARYHSLSIEPDSLPTVLHKTAWTDDGEIMGIRHRHLPLFGVQFHPESFLTAHGGQVVSNFLRRVAPRTAWCA